MLCANEHGTKERVLTESLLDVMEKGLGLADQPARYHDLDELAGKWVEDPEFDRAIEEMDEIDPELWK